MPSPVPTYNVLGLRLAALSLDEACRAVVAGRGAGPRGYICHATAYNANWARSDADLRAAYRGAWLTVPDGMPLVWLGRVHGHRGVTRVYGPDLLSAVADAGRVAGLRHYFYGGTEGVADRLAARLAERFPGLAVAGTWCPPFRDLTDGEFAGLRADVARTRPDVIWVGVSSPRQEKFMARHWRELDAGVMIGVGAAFDFLSGRRAQAPRWMQRGGLEWLFRLGTEPRRLWRRYLVHNPQFAVRALAQLSGLRSYPLEE